MAKPILKSQQSLVDAEKVIQLANDIVAGKIKNLDEIKDEDLQQIVKDGIEYQRDNINSVGSAALGSMGILGGVEIANQAIKYSDVIPLQSFAAVFPVHGAITMISRKLFGPIGSAAQIVRIPSFPVISQIPST